MRQMTYVTAHGEFATYDEVKGQKYTIKMTTITPPDEVEARVKFNKEREKAGFTTFLPIHN